MMFRLSLATLVATIPWVQCHFTFVRIFHNGEWKEPLQYIRYLSPLYALCPSNARIRNKTNNFYEPSTNYAGMPERGYNNPTFFTDYPESVRCGRDNMAWATKTDVLKIKAGDTLEVAHQRYEPPDWRDNQWYNCPNRRGACDPPTAYMDINHPGPFLVHLSKVPEGEDVRSYDGSGDWVKIHTLGMEYRENNTKTPVFWIPWNNQQEPARFVFNVPPQTPAGQYLMRLDIIWSGFIPQGDGTFPPILGQMYPSCAQIEIESDSSGPLPRGVRIPEIFSPNSTGMTTSLAMYRNTALDQDYEYPGGPIWDGEKLNTDKPAV
ncbi:hypothetical protein CC78DRAFT_605021 [Lojkania enalia]|uniref:AA9 family lytic polysaccharide monooxygenase n=1 Tax=Lojkania enalia TaxID=147567 RepID=A0A9P4N5A9_9PLEO|nr:hypothetical protein CC78DRAFT_605021 [Didymosphaeria enalia]